MRSPHPNPSCDGVPAASYNTMRPRPRPLGETTAAGAGAAAQLGHAGAMEEADLVTGGATGIHLEKINGDSFAEIARR